MLYGSLDGEASLGGDWVHVYVWLNPFAIHLKLSQDCLLLLPNPSTKLKVKKKFFLTKRVKSD